MSINVFPIEILLYKSNEERTEVFSRLLFAFAYTKITRTFSDTFSYLFHNYDVTSLEIFIQPKS